MFKMHPIHTVLMMVLTVSVTTGGLSADSTLPGGTSETRLADAAMQGDQDALQNLLKQKTNVNAAQGDGMTALHWAAFKEQLASVQLLLKAGANVNAVTRIGGLTPLMIACKNGNPAIIESLLRAGGQVNTPSTIGMTPLMAVAASGSVEAVNVLLNHGAEVNAREAAHGQTALMFASAENRAGVIRSLASHGADSKTTTLVVKLEASKLDDNGNPIPAKGGEGSTVTGGNTMMGGMTALLFAARDGNLDAVRALIETGADVNQVSDGDHSSPLVIAAANGHYEVAKFLVDHGANPNLTNVDGLTALYATIDTQYAPVSWAPVPLTDQEKVSHLDLMKALVAHGADPNLRLLKKLWFSPTSHDQQWINPAGATPFWRASQATDLAAMRILVSGGADPKLASSAGTTPLMMAAGLGWAGNFTQTNETSWLDSVKYCVELGLDVNAIDSQGYTALMGAAWRGNNALIQMMVDHGAHLDSRNKRGWSVTDMANGPALRSSVPMTHPETIAFLEKLGAPALTRVEGEAILGSKRTPRAGSDKNGKKEEAKPDGSAADPAAPQPK